MSFVNDSPQPNISQFIFDVAVSENVVSYTQTPLCGWLLTYTANIAAIATATATVTVGQTVVTGNPSWATFDTTLTPPKWTMKSSNNLDANTFTIT